MTFWFSPYNSSAQQQFFESINDKQEQADAEILAESVAKSFAARLTTANWSFENYKIERQSTHDGNVCLEYEAELLSPGDEFLQKICYNLSLSKMSNDQKILIKKVAETVADDRYLKLLQMHFSYLQLHSTDGHFICQLITNRVKNRYLCITVKLVETNNSVESSAMAPTLKTSPGRIWRLFKRK